MSGAYARLEGGPEDAKKLPIGDLPGSNGLFPHRIEYPLVGDKIGQYIRTKRRDSAAMPIYVWAGWTDDETPFDTPR